MKVLLAEDEDGIAIDVATALRAARYHVERASEGEDAWFRGETGDYDLIILDLGLPKLDGLTILKRWREAGLPTPILVLTARGRWNERVEGIDAGADDYLPKPFQMEELLARVRALIRRSAGVPSAVIDVGALSLDTRQMRLSVGGVARPLSPLEYRVMAYLMLHRDRVVSPGELLEHLHGTDDAREANALEAIVARLRKKLGPTTIETRRGFGYQIAAT
ncbi:MAG: response regulator transcription factor [Geminicoccaceae bacterium]